MKRIAIILVAAMMVVPSFVQAQSNKKGKVVSPVIEGKNKVREINYDTICKFTTFNPKLVYYCNFDYSKLTEILDHRKPEWGTFRPVMNYLQVSGRAPMRICAIYAINPDYNDETGRQALLDSARIDAVAQLKTLEQWMKDKDMKNKLQLNVAQIDYRYWKGDSYFTQDRPKDDLIHVGVILYFGSKKINLFPSASDGARTFNDVKFFPNDATVQPSYDDMLDDLAQYLKEDERLEVLLIGHSDNVGTDAYNKGLSRQRATEVKKALISRGVPEFRIEIEARGDSEPIGDNKTYEGRIANNRVNVKIQ